jgi:hypothetical protein
LTDIGVPETSGVLVALDNFSEAHRGDVLLSVLAAASWWWLLFGRVFCVVLRTDDNQYVGPLVGGAALVERRRVASRPPRALSAWTVVGWSRRWSERRVAEDVENVENRYAEDSAARLGWSGRLSDSLAWRR